MKIFKLFQPEIYPLCINPHFCQKLNCIPVNQSLENHIKKLSVSIMNTYPIYLNNQDIFGKLEWLQFMFSKYKLHNNVDLNNISEYFWKILIEYVDKHSYEIKQSFGIFPIHHIYIIISNVFNTYYENFNLQHDDMLFLSSQFGINKLLSLIAKKIQKPKHYKIFKNFVLNYNVILDPYVYNHDEDIGRLPLIPHHIKYNYPPNKSLIKNCNICPIDFNNAQNIGQIHESMIAVIPYDNEKLPYMIEKTSKNLSIGNMSTPLWNACSIILHNNQICTKCNTGVIIYDKRFCNINRLKNRKCNICDIYMSQQIKWALCYCQDLILCTKCIFRKNKQNHLILPKSFNTNSQKRRFSGNNKSYQHEPSLKFPKKK